MHVSRSVTPPPPTESASKSGRWATVPTPMTVPLTIACGVCLVLFLGESRLVALHPHALVDASLFDAPAQSLSTRLQELQESLSQVGQGLAVLENASATLLYVAPANAVPTVRDKVDGPTTVAQMRAQLDEDVSSIHAVTSQTSAEVLKASETKTTPRAAAPVGVVGDPYADEMPAEPADPNPGGPYNRPPDPWANDGLSPEEENTKRRESVVQAFRDSFDAYRKYAWGYDELQPRSKAGKNWNDDPVNSLGLTLIDALATAHLMGLTDYEEEALDYVRNKLKFDVDTSISAFETTIRVIGSLLSIFELRGEKDQDILQKAVDIANRVLWAYNTTSGIPQQTVNLATHHHNNPDWSGGTSILSEFGTVQLELRTLSYHTKNPIYDMKATHIMDVVEARAPKDMLCPVFLSVVTAKWMTDHITVGALGDSFYEYLLKQWLLTGRTEDRYKAYYTTAATAIVDKLIFKSKPSKYTYVSEWKRQDVYHKMDELACFVGGMLALGAQAFEEGPERDKMMETADGLATTCYMMFHRQKSGIAPEFVEFPNGIDFVNGQGYYLLRPETMESIFYMWRLTKDPKWREYGWDIFSAIQRFCRTESGGYAGLREVNVKAPIKDNLQQSFWLAETLKYSFLLFADDDVLSLDEWVFNTEAHPLKIRQRDPLDVWREYEDVHGDMPWFPPSVQGVTPTETKKMRMARATHKDKHQKTQRDNNGEEMEGLPDDDGGQFDARRGMDGIRRGANKKGKGELDFHKKLKPRDGPAANDVDEDAAAAHEAESHRHDETRRPSPPVVTPKPFVPPLAKPPGSKKHLDAAERAAALERQRQLRAREINDDVND